MCFADLLKPLANLGSIEERLKAEKYPACKSCKVFADSFNKVRFIKSNQSEVVILNFIMFRD